MELSYPRSQELEHASAVHQPLSNTSWELRGGIGSLHVKPVLNNTGWAFFWGLRKASKGQMDTGGTLTAHTTGHSFTVRMTSLVLPNTEESMQFLIMDTSIITRNRQIQENGCSYTWIQLWSQLHMIGKGWVDSSKVSWRRWHLSWVSKDECVFTSIHGGGGLNKNDPKWILWG